MGSIQRLSPIDNRVTWQGSWAEPLEIDAAYERSRHAFRDWARTAIPDRLDTIQRYAQSLERNKDAISLCITLESGKPLWESKQEVVAAKSKVENAIDAFTKRRSESSSGSTSLSNVIRYHPLGTVLVLGPYNLPLHLPGAHIVPSILAGIQSSLSQAKRLRSRRLDCPMLAGSGITCRCFGDAPRIGRCC